MAHTCPHNRRTIAERLGDVLTRYDLTCGRSSKFTKLSNASVAFEQAHEAHAISKKLKTNALAVGKGERDRIYTFDSYSIDYLVNQLSQKAVDLLGASYAAAVIAEIADHDALSHTNNYEFLRAYLMYERRNSTVAEQLHMHRNNVSYRIGRIEQQYGIDVSDPKLRLDILFAYHIRDAVLRESGQ